MTGWNYRRLLIISVVFAALVWGVVFLLSTKPVQLWVLRRALGMEDLAFEQAQLSWGEANLENLEMEDRGLLLQAREARVTFTGWKALLGHRDAIDGIWLNGARLWDADRSLGPWPGRALTALDELRGRDDLLQLETFSLNGVWKRGDGTEVPLSLTGTTVDFSSDGEMEALVGVSSGSAETSTLGWSFTGKLFWNRSGGDLILHAEGNPVLQYDFMALPVTGRFSSDLRFSSKGQFLRGNWLDGERALFAAELSRPSVEVPFSGLGKLALTQGELASLWKPLKAFQVDANAKGVTQWSPEQGTGTCDLQLDGNSSSVWYGQVGLLSWMGESSLRFDPKGISMEGFRLDAVTERGEALKVSQSGRVRFPEMTGEDAKVVLELQGLRLDWFSNWTPWEMDETWKLSDVSFEFSSETESWRVGLTPMDMLRGTTRMASATRLAAFAEETNGTGWSLDLEIDGSVERGLLAELLPDDGPLGVFDGEDARGSVAGKIRFSNKGMVFKRGIAILTSGGGARRLVLQSEREVTIDPDQPDFLAADTRGEWLSVKGNNLPIDGLIRWEGGGELQGDAHAFSGKVSRDEHGWTFRSDDAVEIGSALIVHEEANYGESLRVRADLEVKVDWEGCLRMNCSDFVLDGERPAMAGSLALVADPSENGDMLVSVVESSGLKVDLTTLAWLGFPEFPDLEGGSFEVGELNATLGDEPRIELSGVLEDFRVVDEMPINGGLQGRLWRQPDGFSTWAKLTLVREDRECDVTLDVFLPSDGNASRRRLSLSGESVWMDELQSFAATIPAPEDRAALLSGKRFPSWMEGEWELSFDVFHVTGLPPFEKIAAGVEVRPRGLSLTEAKANWAGGALAIEGALSLGGSEVPEVRLERLDVRADEIDLGMLTKRADGTIKWEISGWSAGRDWSEVLGMFSGKTTLGGMNGLLRLGPLGKKDDTLPERSWSLHELGKALGGETTVGERQKVLLGKLDTELKTVKYDAFRIHAKRMSDGNFTMSELSLQGPSFQVSGRGKTSPFPAGKEGEALNLNLSVGARGDSAKILDELGVLSPVKAVGEYRLLKETPLIVQGTLANPNFSNFWALVAESLGLESFDPLPQP